MIAKTQGTRRQTNTHTQVNQPAKKPTNQNQPTKKQTNKRRNTQTKKQASSKASKQAGSQPGTNPYIGWQHIQVSVETHAIQLRRLLVLKTNQEQLIFHMLLCLGSNIKGKGTPFPPLSPPSENTNPSRPPPPKQKKTTLPPPPHPQKKKRTNKLVESYVSPV